MARIITREQAQVPTGLYREVSIEIEQTFDVETPWEETDQLIVILELNAPRGPFTLQKRYNLPIHEKSGFYQLVESVTDQPPYCK